MARERAFWTSALGLTLASLMMLPNTAEGQTDSTCTCLELLNRMEQMSTTGQQPVCYGCFTFQAEYYECAHSGADDPCLSTLCIINRIDTASCYYNPQGTINLCLARELPGQVAITQQLIRPYGGLCLTWNPGPLHDLTNLTWYGGCVTCYIQIPQARCDSNDCFGEPAFDPAPKGGRKFACGCAE